MTKKQRREEEEQLYFQEPTDENASHIPKHKRRKLAMMEEHLDINEELFNEGIK